MLRTARNQKFVCLRKPKPAPGFRGLAAPIPPLCFRALFLIHPQKAVVTFDFIVYDSTICIVILKVSFKSSIIYYKYEG